jgi:hypothetical protein
VTGWWHKHCPLLILSWSQTIARADKECIRFSPFVLGRENQVMSATFTFYGETDRIEVRLVECENPAAAKELNTVWLDSTVTVQAGAFLGSFKASVTTNDLVRLHDQLKSALTSLSGTALFQSSGGGLSLAIKLDSDEKTYITGLAHPKRLRQGILHFEIDTNHFALTRSLGEIKGALREFPTEQSRNQERAWS